MADGAYRVLKSFAAILAGSGEYCDDIEMKIIKQSTNKQIELSITVKFDTLIMSQYTRLQSNGSFFFNINGIPASFEDLNNKMLINTFKQFQFATLNSLQYLLKICKSNGWNISKASPKNALGETIAVNVLKTDIKMFDVSFTMNATHESLIIAGSVGVPVEGARDKQIFFGDKTQFEHILASASNGWN